MSRDASFEERVRRVRWCHEFDFGGGRCAARVRAAATAGSSSSARAVEREDPRHACEPLLGLAQYDPRFR